MRRGQLVWPAPALWLAALGFFAAAALRNTAAATSPVAFVWTGEQLFGGALADNAAHRLLHLFANTSWGSRAQLRQQPQPRLSRRRGRHLVASRHELRHRPPPQNPRSHLP
ncbi:hypothetical protein [Nonomuraea dietziae]|uniref:Uncharacterized protein n=1 Tax=Nonomuraea dietziae TaxID=65515 RepID=A0A7W5UYU1_9ACTN|nr:hypothetical protein [Nonomuraea dietziae]MBB3724550.1 hypothetical protein [Nonomuraea dietziae]